MYSHTFWVEKVLRQHSWKGGLRLVPSRSKATCFWIEKADWQSWTMLLTERIVRFPESSGAMSCCIRPSLDARTVCRRYSILPVVKSRYLVIGVLYSTQPCGRVVEADAPTHTYSKHITGAGSDLSFQFAVGDQDELM